MRARRPVAGLAGRDRMWSDDRLPNSRTSRSRSGGRGRARGRIGDRQAKRNHKQVLRQLTGTRADGIRLLVISRSRSPPGISTSLPAGTTIGGVFAHPGNVRPLSAMRLPSPFAMASEAGTGISATEPYWSDGCRSARHGAHRSEFLSVVRPPGSWIEMSPRLSAAAWSARSPPGRLPRHAGGAPVSARMVTRSEGRRRARTVVANFDRDAVDDLGRALARQAGWPARREEAARPTRMSSPVWTTGLGRHVTLRCGARNRRRRTARADRAGLGIDIGGDSPAPCGAG